jgi:carboxyl-terminal processing protease
MRRFRGISIVVFVAIVAFMAGLFFGTQNETQATLTLTGPENVPTGVDFDPVWKAWGILEEKYVPTGDTEDLSKQDRVWGIIQGLAESYGDPYTTFLPPQRSTAFAEEISGSFGGVGFEIGMREDILTVIAPLKGTPAEAAGILSGDLILEVDGISTSNMNIDEAIEHLRGEVGTEVVLTIAREGEREFLTIHIVRDIINIPTLDSELRDDGVYVISLYNFGGTSVGEMRKALREFVESESEDLVLDLRGNPGGYLEAAVTMASWFLPIGKTVVTEDYGNEEIVTHRSKGIDVSKPEWDIVVLIDQGSASASEILAGALREHDKAILVGETTYGKGSVQELVDITPDTSLKVTVARWLTPNGVSISKDGLEPDFTVPMTREDHEADQDPQLDAAVIYLLTGVLETTEEEEIAAEDAEVEESDDIE